jgi:hypothetical protein
MFLDTQGRYSSFFSLHEITHSRVLQAIYYVLCLSFFVTFFGWIERSSISVSTFVAGTHICPPYFMSCGDYFFLQMLPYGYSQSGLYVFLFLVLGWGIHGAYTQRWSQAHAALLICFIWKCIVGFVFTYGMLGNFDYYDMALACVWLFAMHKEYFARVVFVLMYVLASSIKIDSGWIVGEYFTTLVTGAPLFSGTAVPIITNLLICMQMLGAWLLLSGTPWLQRTAFVYFFLFHVYSGVLVNYRYITISIPALWVLFYEYVPMVLLRIRKSSLFGYGFLVILVCGQLVGILIAGDQKKTLEGNYYGMYMFEANHQCYSRAEIYRKGILDPEIALRDSHVANNRCDPYHYWFRLHTKCVRDTTIERIRWTFDHSINGGPYERIVDVENTCTLAYAPFAHNPWIRLDGVAERLDIPVYKNGFAYPLDPRIMVPVERQADTRLVAHLSTFYWILWCISLGGAVIFVLYNQFRT